MKCDQYRSELPALSYHVLMLELLLILRVQKKKKKVNLTITDFLLIIYAYNIQFWSKVKYKQGFTMYKII